MLHFTPMGRSSTGIAHTRRMAKQAAAPQAPAPTRGSPAARSEHSTIEGNTRAQKTPAQAEVIGPSGVRGCKIQTGQGRGAAYFNLSFTKQLPGSKTANWT